MKKLVLLVIILGFNIVSCQKEKKEKIIERFIIDLFDDKIPPEEIVELYIEIKPDRNNKLSILERKKGAIGVIQESRNGKGSENTWLIPNYAIKNISNPKVYSFQEYENLSQIEINGVEKIKEHIYVLLDSKKEKILQYFLLNETNDKIISFSLMVKQKKSGSFFSY